MKYKVHEFSFPSDSDQGQLEAYLNALKGEVVSIIPNIKRNSLAQIYGITRRVDSFIIVVKTVQ